MLPSQTKQILRYSILVVIFPVLTAKFIGLIISSHSNITSIYFAIAEGILIIICMMPIFILLFSNLLSNHEKTTLILQNKFDELKSESIKNEQKFRLIADYSYDWEYWEGSDNSLVYVSPSCMTITGYSSEEFYQHNDLLKEIIYSEDLKQLDNYRQAILNGDDVDPVEFRITTKSGETRWINHVCRCVYDDNGMNSGIRVSNRDITKLKILKKEIKVLKGLLPICASCKNIRDDSGYWNQIESYIRDHSEAEFSHGICPNCAKKLYPEFDLFKDI